MHKREKLINQTESKLKQNFLLLCEKSCSENERTMKPGRTYLQTSYLKIVSYLECINTTSLDSTVKNKPKKAQTKTAQLENGQETFYQRGLWMVTKHMKRSSIALAIRVMQNEITRHSETLNFTVFGFNIFFNIQTFLSRLRYLSASAN